MSFSGRKYHGNAPKGGELIATKDSNWQLWDKKINLEGYENYKLVSLTMAVKANFHLGWDVKKQRLVRNADFKVLSGEHVKLFTWVEKIIKERKRNA